MSHDRAQYFGFALFLALTALIMGIGGPERWPWIATAGGAGYLLYHGLVDR